MPDNSASASSNSTTLPDSSARRIMPAVSWPLCAQMPHQRAHLVVRRVGGKRDGRLLAGLCVANSACSGPSHCRAATKSASVCDSLREQRLARRHRQIVARQQVLADRRQMAEALDDAVDARTARFRRRHFPAARDRPRRADLGDRGGQRARQPRAAGDRDLHVGIAGGDQVDQIVFEQQRRARQHRHRDVRLIGGERMHHRPAAPSALQRTPRRARAAPAATDRPAA